MKSCHVNSSWWSWESSRNGLRVSKELSLVHILKQHVFTTVSNYESPDGLSISLHPRTENTYTLVFAH